MTDSPGFAPLSDDELHRDRVSPLAGKRLSRQAAQIIDLLRSKPAVSNAELAQITPRYSARIFDARQRGYEIAIVYQDHASGRVDYVLVREPQEQLS